MYTYLLTPSDYGVLNIFGSLTDLFAVLLTLNCTVGVGRYYFEKEQEDFGSLIFTSMIVVFGLLGLSWFGLTYFSNYFGKLLDVPTKTIIFIVPCVVLIVMSNYILSIFRASKQSKIIRNYGIQQTYAMFGLSVILMLLLKEDRYMGRIWANAIIAAVFAWIAFRKIGPLIQFHFKRKHIRYLLVYSVPLLPAYLSNMILSYFDRIMINSYLGSADAGLYSFAYNIAGLQYMFSNAFMNAWVPNYFEHINSGDHKKHDDEAKSLMRIISFISIGLILFGDWLGKLLSSKGYHSGLELIPLVVLGQFFVSYTVMYKNGISYEKRTWISTVVIVIATVLNIWLNSIFIPQYGIIAAAYTTLASYLVQALLTVLSVQWLLRVHTIHPIKLMGPVILVCGATAVYYVMNQYDLATWQDVLIKVALAGLSGYALLKNELKKLIK
ncbi:MAG: oligosaccharide flippase family protein [Flavobacteriales bacterium]|nr:oligosaccharide flippase family protein [Bacteroidota bacterium]MCB9239851.1 oligosaccharide flippase family protein [Flavobacteriales bacterium]